MPCRLLKELGSELAPCLADIFQTSIISGDLPSDWKKARIAPVFEKGKTCQAENYRPISLTCVCSKLLEHIICHHIHSHFDRYGILSKFQHGFRSRHSCETQLITTMQDLLCHYDNKRQVDIAVLDFSKAFDTVPHRRLMSKLNHYGIDGTTGNWIASFLQDREQCVVVDGEKSGWSHVASGVPQGTVLGPLLFLAYINDLPDQVSSQVRLFADDCLIYRSIASIKDQLDLQADLDALHAWSLTWGMKFNPSKCTILSIARSSSSKLHKYYSLAGEVLSNVHEAKYLGVLLSDDLQWAQHIQSITAKSNSILGLLRRNLHHCPAILREQAYIALIRSRLEYCSSVWDPHLAKDSNKIEMVQRRSARFVTQEYNPRASVTDLLKDLNWPPLKDRRRDLRLVLLYKIIHGEVAIQVDDNILIPTDHRTRSNHPFSFRQLSAKSETLRSSFYHRTIPQWNSLSEQVVTAHTSASFLARLRAAP